MYDPYDKRVAIGLRDRPEITSFDRVIPKDNQLKYVSQMVNGSIFYLFSNIINPADHQVIERHINFFSQHLHPFSIMFRILISGFDNIVFFYGNPIDYEKLRKI